MRLRVGLALLMFGSIFAPAQETPDEATLAAITERGHALYEYDQAAWHGTDAFFTLHPNTDPLTHYICTRTTNGWRVVFPRWDAVHQHLQVIYEAVESPDGTYKARAFDPPLEASDDLTADERALELGYANFERPKRPYNMALLHAPGGNRYVYFYPGQTKNTVWPLGGDVRFTISPDGTRILQKRQLHNAVLDIEFDPATKPTMGFHTHVLSEIPEDTDVLNVLTRRPLIPEYIGTLDGWFFVVATDGSISSMAPCQKGNPLHCHKKKHK